MTWFPFTLSRAQNFNVWLWSRIILGRCPGAYASSPGIKPDFHLCLPLPWQWGKRKREHCSRSLTALGSKDSKLPLWCMLGIMWCYIKMSRVQGGETETFCSSCQNESSLSCDLVTWHIGPLPYILLTEANVEWISLHVLVRCRIYHGHIKLTKILGFSEYQLFRIFLRDVVVADGKPTIVP